MCRVNFIIHRVLLRLGPPLSPGMEDLGPLNTPSPTDCSLFPPDLGDLCELPLLL